MIYNQVMYVTLSLLLFLKIKASKIEEVEEEEEGNSIFILAPRDVERNVKKD